MITFQDHIATTLSEWVLALAAALLTFVIATTTHQILKKLHQDRNWPILKRLSPSLSNLVYVVGMQLFVELAPLTGRTEKWLSDGVYCLSVAIFLQFIRRSALIAIEWSAVRSNQSVILEQGFIPLMRNITTLFIFLTGGIMILKHFNYDVMSLVTALGVSSLAVGLAAKDTLSNMISGFILIIDRNLRPGDRVNLAGTIGDVKEIGLRSTQIRMPDGNTLIVPNSELVNTRILNLSMPTREVICSSTLRIPYSVSFSKIKGICLDCVGQVEKASSAHSPSITLASIADGYQLINIGFWVSDLGDTGTALTDFNERLLAALASQDIHPITSPPPDPAR